MIVPRIMYTISISSGVQGSSSSARQFDILYFVYVVSYQALLLPSLGSACVDRVAPKPHSVMEDSVEATFVLEAARATAMIITICMVVSIVAV